MIVLAAPNYKISPKDVKLDACKAVFGGFGKYEVELAAGKLIQYFQYRNNGWCLFTFEELSEFYKGNHWDGSEMLFGLMGAWGDDYGIQEGVISVVHTGNCLSVTREFVDRCTRRER